MKILGKILAVGLLILPWLSQAQFREGEWYISAKGGIVSTTLYNDDDFTNFGNAKENSWYSTDDYELLDINSGYYGIFTGYVINDHLILESGVYSYRLRQNYERSGRLVNYNEFKRDHVTMLKYIRVPLIAKLGFDFRDDNFLYVFGGLAGGYLYDYYDYSLVRDNLSGRITYEQKIVNGTYEREYYELSNQREIQREAGEVSGLYNTYSFSTIGGLGFEFRLTDGLMAEVFARSEIDIKQVEDHQAEYLRPDGSRAKIWNGKVRYPERPEDIPGVESRQRTTAFSFGFGLGVVYIFQ